MDTICSISNVWNMTNGSTFPSDKHFWKNEKSQNTKDTESVQTALLSDFEVFSRLCWFSAATWASWF